MEALKAALLAGAAKLVAPFQGNDEPAEAPRASVHHKRKGYTQDEIDKAFARTMTGPKATRPRWKTLRRTILLMRNGIKFVGSGRGVSYKRMKPKNIPIIGDVMPNEHHAIIGCRYEDTH